jgi:hypothetical protein
MRDNQEFKGRSQFRNHSSSHVAPQRHNPRLNAHDRQHAQDSENEKQTTIWRPFMNRQQIVASEKMISISLPGGFGRSVFGDGTMLSSIASAGW